MLIQDIRPPKRYQAVHHIKRFHQATQLTGKARVIRYSQLHPKEQTTTVKKKVTQPPTITKRRGWRVAFEFIQYPLIGAVAIGSAYSSTIGQAIIGIYAVLAIALRIKSQVTFAMALFLLVSVPFFQIIHQTGVSQNCAIYAYEMLVIGTIQAIIELWLDSRHTRSKHTAAS